MKVECGMNYIAETPPRQCKMDYEPFDMSLAEPPSCSQALLLLFKRESVTLGQGRGGQNPH